MKNNINTVSYPGKKQLSSTYNHCTSSAASTDKPSETDIDLSLFCKHCKHHNTHYHNHVYSDYITKKMFSIYLNKIENLSYNEMEKKMKIAYNQKRRGNYYDQLQYLQQY